MSFRLLRSGDERAAIIVQGRGGMTASISRADHRGLSETLSFRPMRENELDAGWVVRFGVFREQRIPGVGPLTGAREPQVVASLLDFESLPGSSGTART